MRKVMLIGILFVSFLVFASAETTITDTLVNTTGNLTGTYVLGDGSLLTGIVSYLSKWSTGNFVGSLFTTGADSSGSDSNALFQVLGSSGVPQFQIQNGGVGQASFVARSFLVVNENVTRLNQSQNNLCSEWGFLHIDCNSSTTGSDMGVQDDFEAQGLVYTRKGVYGDTSAGGVYLALGNLTNFTVGGVNGTFTDLTNIFCDFVTNPFSQAQVDAENWILISEGDYEGAPAEMKTFINSSCVEVGSNPGWKEDLSNLKYFFRAIPVFLVLEEGFSEFYVGEDEQSKFEIKIRNGTGGSGFEISDTAGSDEHKASLFKTNILSFDGVTAISSLVYSTISVVGRDSKNFNLEFDARNFNSGHHTFIEGQILGEKKSDMTIDLINLEGDFDHYIKNGQSDTLEKAYMDYRNGTIVDVTAALTNGSLDVSLFELDDSILYLGSTTNFTEIGVSLVSGGSKSIIPLYYYCNSGGWVQASGGISDSTAGFSNSGAISAVNPADRYACNQAMDTDYATFGTAFANTTGYYYIAIRRTQNNLVSYPVENLISVSGALQSFILSDEYIKLKSVSAPPITCDATVAGAIYYDSDINIHCTCNAANWVRMSDYTTTTGCS